MIAKGNVEKYKRSDLLPVLLSLTVLGSGCGTPPTLRVGWLHRKFSHLGAPTISAVLLGAITTQG